MAFGEERDDSALALKTSWLLKAGLSDESSLWGLTTTASFGLAGGVDGGVKRPSLIWYVAPAAVVAGLERTLPEELQQDSLGKRSLLGERTGTRGWRGSCPRSFATAG